MLDSSTERMRTGVAHRASGACAALRNCSYYLGVALGHNAPTDAGV